jgi:aspergillopepsin I
MTDVRNRWVFSSETPSSESAGHTVYDPSLSSTAQELPGYTWNITYGDGSSSSGNVYTDTVTVGGTTVTNQAVELAEQVSTQFQQDTDSDGLLGLAFSSINTGMPSLRLARN